MVGIGDSVRTPVPTRAPTRRRGSAARVPALGGEPAGAARDAPQAARAASAVAAVPGRRRGGRPNARRGRWTPRRGRAQLRRQSGRARPPTIGRSGPPRTSSTRDSPISREPRRGRQLALAEGRGPAPTPGAVSRPSRAWRRPSSGRRSPRVVGPDVDERTADRRYDRYMRGDPTARQRGAGVSAGRWPCAWNRGETIVEFVVDVDGRLGDGPRVVKSSGFQEFDTAARARRASGGAVSADARSPCRAPVAGVDAA